MTTTTAEGLIDTMVALLQGDPVADPPIAPATLAAAADVQAYRDWNIQTLTGPFEPKITFDLPREDKLGLGRNGAAVFDSTAGITLRAFASAQSAAAPGGDGGEVRVRALLKVLRRQIEVALINAPELWAGIQEIKRIRCDQKGSQDGNGVHLGEIIMMFEIVFRQDETDFAQLTVDELELLHLLVQPTDPAGISIPLDITLT